MAEASGGQAAPQFQSSFSMSSGADGLVVQHAVQTSGSMEAHLAALTQTIDLLTKAGWVRPTIQPQAATIADEPMGEGEESHLITGFVLGKNKRGPVIWLYTDALTKKIHGGTIFDREFHLLPFDPLAAKPYPGEAAPSKEDAVAGGYLTPCRIRVIVKPTGKLVGEYPEFRFARLAPLMPQVSAAPAPSPPLTDDTPIADLVKKIKGFLSDTELTLDKLGAGIDRIVARRSQIAPDDLKSVRNIVRAKLCDFASRMDPSVVLPFISRHAEFLGEETCDGIRECCSLRVSIH